MQNGPFLPSILAKAADFAKLSEFIERLHSGGHISTLVAAIERIKRSETESKSEAEETASPATATRDRLKLVLQFIGIALWTD